MLYFRVPKNKYKTYLLIFCKRSRNFDQIQSCRD